uniref:Secreted protein n=1 Tax=Cacopsylla melanoneura TaxID=428564 RepID=A0A8D8QSP2_9HEMI
MPRLKIIRFVPCLMVLLGHQFHTAITKMQNSEKTNWTDVDVTGVKDNGWWKDITQWLGRELCKNKTPENPYTCEDFSQFAAPIANATILRASCEGDAALRGAVVCWLRHKDHLETYKKRTKFEVQFWTDHPNMSHCRFATPTPVYED